jgi:hypothetical protein
MASDVSICSRALHKLGAGTITTLDDNNERARVMKQAYEPVRLAELRRHRWRFAIKRTSLPALSDAPDSDYDYAYELPADFLRLIEGGDLASTADLTDYRGGASALYSLEGRQILTHLGAPLAIRYIANITDTALMDAAFIETLSCRLAFECVERITESASKKDELRKDYNQSVKDAIRANAIEGASQSPADAEWVMARLG